MQSIYEYIRNEKPLTVDKMYGRIPKVINTDEIKEKDKIEFSKQSPWACKAIFQSLSSLSKNYVMRLIMIKSPLQSHTLLNWNHHDHSQQHYDTIEELKGLRILLVTSEEENDNSNEFDINNIKNSISLKRTRAEIGADKIIMNPYFQDSLIFAISNPIEPWSVSEDALLDIEPPSVSVLDRHSVDNWNDVLTTLVNLNSGILLRKFSKSSAGNDRNIIEDKGYVIQSFLLSAGLMAETIVRGIKKISITSSGYEYMLKDQQSQVWVFIFQSLARYENQEEALLLLFMLSYCEVGKGYQIKLLTKVQKDLICEFSHFGIIYMKSTSDHSFYPTRTSVNMIFQKEKIYAGNIDKEKKNNDISNINKEKLSIIVQTNNQVIAYVSSELHLSMLKLFVDITLRMPNMAVGIFSKEKIKDSYKMGISSSQILDFLNSHAHSLVENRDPIIPANVSDQLILWEAELYRIHAMDAVVIHCNEIKSITMKIFNKMIDYSKRLNVYLWSNSQQLLLAVTEEGYDALQSFSSDIL
jgi:transcription initiation factor TFIIH subunit 4